MTVDLVTGKTPVLHAEERHDAARWAEENRDAVRAVIAEHGAVIVRGLPLLGLAQADAVFRCFGTLIEEREAFAPRQRFSEGVYSATRWPANQHMCLHHELSYLLEPPELMMFACLVPAVMGGETPLADGAKVLRALPPDLVERAERLGWMLIRNYNDEIGASIVEAFGSDDRRAVEDYCAARRIECEWLEGGVLRTRQRRGAVLRHPVTGERCWFNQIAFLNQWTMEPEVREFLVEAYGEEGLPFDTRFGNGDPVGADIVAAVDDAYAAHTVSERWQAGDLMLVDNLRVAHGRESFEGPREVLVAMADPVRLAP